MMTFSFVGTERLDRIEAALKHIIERLKQMAETQDQEALDLAALSTQMATIKQGILDLETALANAGQTVSPAVQAALDTLKGNVTDTAAALPPPAPKPGP